MGGITSSWPGSSIERDRLRQGIGIIRRVTTKREALQIPMMDGAEPHGSPRCHCLMFPFLRTGHAVFRGRIGVSECDVYDLYDVDDVGDGVAVHIGPLIGAIRIGIGKRRKRAERDFDALHDNVVDVVVEIDHVFRGKAQPSP